MTCTYNCLTSQTIFTRMTGSAAKQTYKQMLFWWPCEGINLIFCLLGRASLSKHIIFLLSQHWPSSLGIKPIILPHHWPIKLVSIYQFNCWPTLLPNPQWLPHHLYCFFSLLLLQQKSAHHQVVWFCIHPATNAIVAIDFINTINRCKIKSKTRPWELNSHHHRLAVYAYW